jgi:hypothetical protein
MPISVPGHVNHRFRDDADHSFRDDPDQLIMIVGMVIDIVHTENFIRRSINAMQHCYILIVWLDHPQSRLLECR